MASITMTSSLLGGSTLANRSPVATTSRRLVITNAARGAEGEKVKVVNCDTEKESNNGRRDLVFAAAAAAVCSVARIAVAVEPKRGTPEARKSYAPEFWRTALKVVAAGLAKIKDKSSGLYK